MRKPPYTAEPSVVLFPAGCWLHQKLHAVHRRNFACPTALINTCFSCFWQRASPSVLECNLIIKQKLPLLICLHITSSVFGLNVMLFFSALIYWPEQFSEVWAFISKTARVGHPRSVFITSLLVFGLQTQIKSQDWGTISSTKAFRDFFCFGTIVLSLLFDN